MKKWTRPGDVVETFVDGERDGLVLVGDAEFAEAMARQYPGSGYPEGAVWGQVLAGEFRGSAILLDPADGYTWQVVHGYIHLERMA